jgi:transglutaminase-like putative cysteine protease
MKSARRFEKPAPRTRFLHPWETDRMRGSAVPGSGVERFFQYSLLGLVASGFLALAGSGHLDPATIAITASALLVRALLIAGVLDFEFSGAAANWLALACIVFYGVDYQFLSRDFIAATVRLVLFLASIKTLGASSSRDYAFVRVIAFLELLAACVISASLSFFVFLALFLIFAIATFAAGEIRKSAARPGVVVRESDAHVSMRLGTLTAALALGILAMTSSLFFLLPRTARAALQHFVSSRYFVTGFSNEVRLGGVGEIEQRSTAMMHIAMEDGSRPPALLRWKGGTLAEFDGHRWFNPRGFEESFPRTRQGCFILEPSVQRLLKGKMMTYVVHVSDEASGGLFFAGDPAYLWLDAPAVLRLAPGSFRPRYGFPGAFSYEASSFAPDADTPVAGDVPEPALRTIYLQLPKLDARIAPFSAEVSRNAPSDYGKARAVERYLREHYVYTLRQPSRPPADPLASFLFERRKGHCEYFASALAIMLRTLGIPTRVVTGFDSGIYNPISGRQIIRASDAHSWVEAWFPDRGWVTMDATPTEAGVDDTLASRFSLWMDAAGVFWQDWVLDYNLQQQLTLAARVGDSSRRFRLQMPDVLSASWWTGLAAKRGWDFHFVRRYVLPLLVICAALGSLIWLGPLVVRRTRTRRRVRGIRQGDVRAGDATLLYRRMLRSLHRRGVEKPAWLTPFEFAALVRDPELALLVEEVTRAYNDLRFGEHRGAAQQMMALLEELEAFPAARTSR